MSDAKGARSTQNVQDLHKKSKIDTKRTRLKKRCKSGKNGRINTKWARSTQKG